MYNYYYYGDCYCVVGTVYAFTTTEEMIDYMGGNGIEVDVPDYASDDMICY